MEAQSTELNVNSFERDRTQTQKQIIRLTTEVPKWKLPLYWGPETCFEHGKQICAMMKSCPQEYMSQDPFIALFFFVSTKKLATALQTSFLPLFSSPSSLAAINHHRRIYKLSNGDPSQWSPFFHVRSATRKHHPCICFLSKPALSLH